MSLHKAQSKVAVILCVVLQCAAADSPVDSTAHLFNFLFIALTHLDWNAEATLIHFQGQYLTICELDYTILQGEIQNTPKNKTAVDIGEFCLVEDLTSARWYRGRVQNRKEDLFDVFLIDHGNVLSVNIDHISSCSSELFILPPKIVCGFLANVLLLKGSCSVIDEYLANLIGQSVTGYIQALLPHKVLLLEASDINNNIVRHGLGRHVDTETFLLLVEMLTEVQLKQNIEPVPDLLIEKPRGQEFSFKPSGLRGHEQILSFCGPRLPCGTRAKVRVTAAVKPGLFYCQMVSKETELWEMSRKLAEVCEYTTKEHTQKTPENLGLLCSIKGKDGRWYRGFVQYLPVNSQVRVLFIDYGFLESVKVENVHKLPSGIYSTPIMAFPCSLSCLSDQDEALKTQQLSFLKAGLLGKVLDVDIRGFDEDRLLYPITVIGAEDNRVKKPEIIQEIPAMKIESVFEREEFKTLNETLEEEELQVNSVFVGYVEHVQNPSNFWIRTQKRNDEFEEMMAKMSDHFDQVKLDEDVLLNPELGTMCCAVYEEDMHFYRGVVTDTLEHGAEVLFIDFGNIEKVPHMLIKKIPETFASKSAFAICCSLVNVIPLDEVWTNATSCFFKRAVSNKALLVHVVEVKKNKFVVDLKEMGVKTIRASLKPVAQKNTEKTRCPEYGVTSDVNECNEQWEDCEDEEKKSTKETDKVQTPASFKALTITPGCDFAVRCISISSPSEFWCQPLDKAQELEELMAKVQHYYSTKRVPLRSGDSCCVAVSPKDKRGYRAFVIEQMNQHVKVMLVDFGNTIMINEHNLQAIMPEFLNLEGLAFRCSLYNGIEPAAHKNSGYWTPEVLNTMTDFVLNSAGALRCKVVSQLNIKDKGLCNVVDLHNAQSKQSITKLLVEQGMATEAAISTKQMSTVFPESFTYSSYDLTPGKEEHVFITHVSSHCELYCHLERNTEVIELLETKISEESEKMIQASTKAVVNKLCLAKYLDGKWYRGLTHPVQSPLHLNVFFVDYGNTNISEKNHVMLIPRDSGELLYTPMQALRCSLASVSKGEFYADVKEWLDGAILNKQVRAVIVGNSDDGSFDVELFDGDVNINEKVNELIFSLSPKPKANISFDINSIQGYQKSLSSDITKPSVKCKNQRNRRSSSSPACKAHRGTQAERETHKKTGNTRSVRGKKQHNNTKVKQGNEGNTKNHVPEKPLKSSPDKDQREYLDTNTKSKHTQLTEETQIPQLSCLPNMKVGGSFMAKCFVSHIDSVDSFFLQLSVDESAILKMVEDLNSGVLRDSLTAATSLRINDLVLAEYEEDGALYRAVVKDFEGSSCLKVEFVDYGNSAVIAKEKIYSIPKEYLSQPRFGIPCSLLYTNLYKDDESFTEAVMEKPLWVDFVCQWGTQWKVKIEIHEVPAILGATKAALKSSVKASDWADAVIPSKIQAGTENATFLSVLSNGNFYIRLNKTSELLAALKSRIADNLYKCKVVAEEDVKVGLKCLVKVDKDTQWHRAVVQHVGLGKSQVLLVDQGVSEEIPNGLIRNTCSDLTEIQNLAVLCKVHSLGFSERACADTSCWETLQLLVDKEVKLTFVCYSKVDQLWVVEIVMNGLFLVQQNEMIQTPAETRNETEEEEKIHLDVNTSPLQQLVFAPVDIDKMYPGFAAAVTTPFEFCLVLEDLLLIMNKLSLMLDDLPEQMPPLPEVHLVPGTCCLIKSESKNKWCRAEIVNADTIAVLNLVDYGHCECMQCEDFSELKVLPAEMTNIPKVTFPCILRGVKPVDEDGQWTDDAAVFFQQCLYQKNLQIFFREFESNTHWKVDILADAFVSQFYWFSPHMLTLLGFII
uniref:Tudor domain containing 15 n=1 Tax=Labrus bergylta TaxID=56723 RepID=A0A3Q3GFW4_9LABR